MNHTLRLGIALVAVIVGVVLASGLRLDGDLRTLLPSGGDDGAALEAVASFRLAETLLFEVDGSDADEATLLAEVRALGEALRGIEGTGVVRAEATLADALALEQAIRPHAAAFLSADALQEALSEAGLQRTFEGHLAMLMAGGALGEQRVSRDPLGLTDRALSTLRGADGTMQVRDGLLRDATGKRAVIVAWPDTPTTMIGPGHPMVPAIEAAIAERRLPVTWLGGHRVAHGTATTVDSDVRRAGSVGVVALLLVLLFGFRTVRPVLGAAGPVTAALLAGAAAAAYIGPVHGIALAFASALIGLAVDVWIHLHATASLTEGDRTAAFAAAWARLRGAIALSAVSTGLAFAMLTDSAVPVIAALGVVGVCTLAGAVAGAYLLGPTLLRLAGPVHLRSGPPARLSALATPLAALLALTAAGIGWTQFDADPRRLLAMPAQVLLEEASITERYELATTRALVVLEGEPSALRERTRVLEAALAAHPVTEVRGAGQWLPSDAHRAALLAQLPSPAALDARIQQAAEAVGFRGFPGAGDAVRAQLTAPVRRDLWDNTAIAPLLTRSWQEHDGHARALISLGLPSDAVGYALRDTAASVDPEARLLQPALLVAQGFEATKVELLRAGGIALTLLTLLLAFRYRDPVQVAAALAPCLAAVAVAAGTHGWLGVAFNPVSMAGLVLVVGMSMDYGVFIVEARQQGAHTETARGAVWLSAITSIVGFGALMVARSPAVSGLGLTVTSGLTAAAITALVLLPAALDSGRSWPAVWVGRWALRLAAILVALVQLDVIVGNLLVPEPPCGECVAIALPAERVPGGRRVGSATMTRHHGVWLLSTGGDPYETGLAMADLGGSLRDRLERDMFDSFERAVPNPLSRTLITRGALLFGHNLDDYIEPAHLLELQGQVDGSTDHVQLHGPLYTRKLLYQAVHDFGQALVDTPLLGCTAFAAGGPHTADGHWLLARNFDFNGAEAMDRDKIVRVHRPVGGHAFLSVGFLGPLGAVSGFNEAGIGVVINAAGSDAPPRLGTPMTLIVREILERASSLDEVQAILEARRGFVAENVVVVDATAGLATVFEVSPQKVVRREPSHWIAVSNHFREPEWANDATNQRRIAEITTVPRLARMEELVSRQLGVLSPAGARTILADRMGVGDRPLPRGHRHAIDADLATHAVVFDITEQVAWVSRYPHVSAGWVRVSLTETLAGDHRGDLLPPMSADDALAALHTNAMRALVARASEASDDEALRLLTEALRHRPDHPEPMLAMGQLQAKLGNAGQARELLEAALAAPPEYAHQVREAVALLAELP